MEYNFIVIPDKGALFFPHKFYYDFTLRSFSINIDALQTNDGRINSKWN